MGGAHMLVRVVKSWKGQDFLRQTPGGKGLWDGIQFTFDSVDECDVLIMLNNQMKTDVTCRCPRENVWAIMQEPYMKGHSDWMAERHEAFNKIFTNYIPVNNPKYIISHPADPWHVNKTFDELTTITMPAKNKIISWIAGNPTDLPGHFKRSEFLNFVRKDTTLDIDYYGRAIRFIEDKWDGLAPYKYSIVLQNSSSADYWTDMVADSFLSWTVPIYYGCTNLEAYFPKESFIRIDIEQPERSLEIIKKTIRDDNWEKRLPALAEARTKILYNYQFFPHIAKCIRNYATESGINSIQTIPAYHRSAKARFYRFKYKLKRLLKFKY